MRRPFATALCLLLFFAAACGGENADTTENAYPSPPEGGSTDETDDEIADEGDGNDDSVSGPGADEEPRDNVNLAAPEGWHLLSAEGRAEIQNSERGLFETPGPGFLHIGGFSSEEAPHPTGAGEEWDEWRESASLVMVYAAPEAISDQAEALRTHGEAFIEGFDRTGVEQMRGYAIYKHGEDDPRRLACVTNENGTYIFAGLARTDEAAALLETYQHELKPE